MSKDNNKNILTGQQIGLLGGPLYTVYKVLGAAKLAEATNGKAVFWMETNDADFNEINHFSFIDSGSKLKTVKWDIDSEGYSCGNIKIDGILPGLLSGFFDSLTQTENTKELKDTIISFYEEGKTLGEASGKFFKWLFENIEVDIFDPSDKAFRDFSKKILLEESRQTVDGEQCNAFILRENKRLAFFKRDGSYFLRNGDEIDPSDHTLLPNVKTRSVCQDAWFGTAAYIAGPGEQKYLEEIRPFFKRHKIVQAETVPRMSIDLIEPRVKRDMEKLKISIDDINNFSEEELSFNLVRNYTGFDMKMTKTESKAAENKFISEMKKLGLGGKWFEKELGKISEKAIGMKRREVKEKSAQILKRVKNIYGMLRPLGKRQERVLNIVYYMNLFGGRRFVKFLYENYNSENSVLEIKNG